MKKIINVTLSTIVALALITSCKKEEGIKIAAEKEVEISTKKMANDKNPYDNSGALHNEYLDFFIKRINTSEEINLDKTLLLTEEFYREKKMDFGSEAKERYTTMFDTYAESQEIGRPIIGWLCKLFPELCEYLKPVLFSILDPSHGGTSTDRTLKFIEAIKAQEEIVMNTEQLEREDVEILLNYYAVARYSAGYWHNVAYVQKEKSAWHGPFTEAQVEARCHTCDVVKGDADGATVAGPVGAGVASAAIVLEKIWRWW